MLYAFVKTIKEHISQYGDYLLYYKPLGQMSGAQPYCERPRTYSVHDGHYPSTI